MAEVYLVLSEGPGGFHKLQVLKLMRSDLTDQERPEFLQMFQDEARLAARLNHPNIVQSFEVGAEDGQPFIVMEFLEGQPLHRVQQRARHLGRGFGLDMELCVLCQVLEGLEYAHTLSDYDGRLLNIVHRDVSPQNVFVTYSGQTKLVDFGVAKTLESSKTRAGVVKGKVAYMPPEQVTSGPIDHRADLFSVGVLLWEAIAGQAMHAELSVYESLSRLVRGELPKIRDVAPEVDGELERIVQRALALDPDQRYQSAETFRHDLLMHLEATSKIRTRDVGNSVAQLFARERSDLSQIIRNAMTSPASTREEPASIRHITRRIPTMGQTPVEETEQPKTLETPTTRDPVPAHGLPDPSPAAPSAPPARVKAWPYAALALALAAALGIAALVMVRSPDPAGRELSSSREPAAAQQEPSSKAAEQVEVSIRVQPPGASLLLDGRLLGQSPYLSRERADTREHTLVVSAPGYESVRQGIRLDHDVALELSLDKSAVVPTKPAEAEPPSTSARRSKSVVPKPTRAVPAVSSDPYVDLPPPRPVKRAAPELDKSDPWTSGRTR